MFISDGPLRRLHWQGLWTNIVPRPPTGVLLSSNGDPVPTPPMNGSLTVRGIHCQGDALRWISNIAKIERCISPLGRLHCSTYPTERPTANTKEPFQSTSQRANQLGKQTNKKETNRHRRKQAKSTRIQANNTLLHLLFSPPHGHKTHKTSGIRFSEVMANDQQVETVVFRYPDGSYLTGGL